MKPNKTVMRRLGLNYSQTVAPPRTSVLRTRDLDSTPPPQNPRAQASKMGLTSPPSSRVQESFWFWVIFKGEKIYADDLITNPWTDLFSAPTAKSYKPVTQVKWFLIKCGRWRGEGGNKALTSSYGSKPGCKEGICEIQGLWVYYFCLLFSETRPEQNQFRFRKNITLIFYIKLSGSLS